MASPKSGTALSLVPPDSPEEAYEADVADPGEAAKSKAAEHERHQGKYGAVVVEPHKPSTAPAGANGPKAHWIEIELLDKRKRPLAGERYRVMLSDGTTGAEGTLDEHGFAHVPGIVPDGACKVTFPRLDRRAWKQN